MKQHTTTARVHVRRGNTLILVAGVLALLTIIASVFITRTKGTRDSAAAVQKTMMNQTRVDHIAEMLAEEVTQALFVEPFVPLFVHNRADSNWSRQRTESAQYVGTLVHERNGWDPSNPFNFAPHRVVPWTNWPDEGSTNDTGTLPGFWPHDDDGAPSPFGQPFTLNEANPFGNPGVSDCRWLRDTEPLRWDTNSTADFVPDAFKYWRHLTNISRANNGWRVCRDISDISGAGLVTNLNSPIEQWLVDRQPSANNFDATTGDAVFSNEGQFMGLWNAWLNNDLAVHALAFPYHQPSWIPPNLYNLWNLDGGIDGDGDGVDIDDYERPAAEFISGTARWNVGRVLSDTDGDGFTDAFWFLAPTPVTDGVRHIVSVSIVDNSSMLNANVATRFDPLTSAGHTPADLALFGEGSGSIDPEDDNWRTGLLDSFVNTGGGILQLPSGVDAGLVYSQARLQAHWWAGDNGSDPYDAVADWTDFTAAVGVYDRPDFPTLLANPLERRLYWLYSGTRPLEASFGLTPFSLGDELELRMFNGQNYARVFSRFERALNQRDLDPTHRFPKAEYVDHDILRSDRWFRESSAQIGAPPQVGGLRNAQLLHDLRHRTTLFSGARNELMPPWLRWRWPHRPFGQPTQHLPFLVWLEQRNTNNDFDRVEANFLEQANTKLDLRERRPLAGADPNGGSPEFIPGNGIGYRWLHERLPWVLMDALTDGSHRGRPAMPGYIPGTRNYFPMPPVSKATWYGGAYTGVTGPPSSPAIDKIRRMAAAYSANILAIRDADSVAPVGFEGTLGQAQAASRFYPYSYFDGVPGAPARPSPGPALEWIDHDDDDTTPVVIQPGAIPLPQWGEVAEDRDTRFLGMEIQPFLVEAFIGHVYKTWEVPDESFIDPHPSSVLLKTDEDGAEMHSSVFVVQIANPYDQPIDFFHNAYKYELEAFGEVIDIREAIEQSLHRTELALAPARSNRPSTMILYAIGSAPPDSGNFRNQMIDFLDLKPEDHPVGTYLINIGPLASDLTERDTYEGADVDEGIRLIRTELLPQASGIGIGSAGARVVIDRFNNEELEDALNGQATALTGQPPTYTDSGLPDPLPDPGTPEVWPGVAGGWEPNDQAQTHWMQWARISRAWGNEYDDGDGFAAPYASPVERNPRYIFATSVVTTARDKTSDTRANYATRVYPTPAAPPTESWPGNSFTLATSPDIDTGGEGGLPWITIDYPVIRLCRLTDGTCVELSAYECERVPIPNGGPGVSLDPDVDCAGGALPGFVLFGTRKPTFFDMNKRGDPLWSAATGNRGFPDKGFYHSFYPLQMMQKDRDFEQIGELSNVWLYGHELAFDSGQYSSTEKTFSEHMAAAHRGAGGETDRFINRLQFGALIGRASNVVPNDPRRAVPQMPAGLRVFDAFVCDGPGVNYDPFAPSPRPVEEFVFANANSFTGRMTPGLININTAPPEVMRTIPHWYKLVHSRLFQVPGVDVLARLPRSHLPESVVSYRERFINNGDETDLGFAPGPDLSNRSVLANVAQMRGERGVESIGELLLLADLPSQGGEILYGNVGPDYFIDEDAWRIDFPSAGFTDFATAPSQEPFSEDNNFNERFFGAMLSVDRDLPNGACCLGGGFCQDWTRDECESANGVFDGPYTWCDFPNLDNCNDGHMDVQFDEDGFSGDAEEANLLFAGASNLITTRSDVFTVYFRVRGFRQNADTGRWDATDLSSIVSDTRYVMVVDRSGVNRPGDPPKILLLDKLPD